MKSSHFAALEKAMSDWIDQHCETDEWPDGIVGDYTSLYMAKAARSVFDACMESQDYAKREGYVKDA